MSEGAPLVALLARPGAARRAVPLLSIVGRTAPVVSWQRRGDATPTALVATSLAALALLDGGVVPNGLPWAVWARTPEQLGEATERGAALVLTAEPALVASGAVLVPPLGVEVARWSCAAPVVRQRRRARLGIEGAPVVRIADDEAPDEAALAWAAAAVVHGPATLVALAMGTPTITSAETARRLGLRPGRDVEVAAGPTAALALAEEVAADESRAAALSRRGRRCAEHHLDLGPAAAAVASRLALEAAASPGAQLVTARLAELASAPGDPQALRVRLALASLGGDGEGSAA